MSTKALLTTVGIATLLLAAEAASAHPGHGTAGGFSAGVGHPFSGLDHILAMIAVGLCAVRIGGRTTWLLPLSFVAAMVLGGGIAVGGAQVPMVEQAIAASVLVLGLIVAAGSKLATPIAFALVALFGLFHGYAHGAEMHAGMAPWAYALGFVLATLTLHAIGIGAGSLLKNKTLWRLTGGAIALCGVLLFLA